MYFGGGGGFKQRREQVPPCFASIFSSFRSFTRTSVGRSWVDVIAALGAGVDGLLSRAGFTVLALTLTLGASAPRGSSVTGSPGAGVPTRGGVPASVLASLSFSNSDGSRRDDGAGPVRARELGRLTGELVRRTADARVRDSAAI